MTKKHFNLCLSSIILLLSAVVGLPASAQQFDDLWATGSAVPGGTQQLTKRPDGQFRFIGKLNAGELKVMTTNEFRKGETRFLRPQFVDSYLINNGLAYSLTTDETQDGWVVSFQEDCYTIVVNPNNNTLKGELRYPWNEVLIAGSAFKGGSDRNEWKRDNMLPFVRDHENPYVFTWEGELGIYQNVVEPGRFKLEGQMTWGPRELHPYAQDEDILESTQMRIGGDDTKWSVSQPGTYRITVDLFNETIHSELINGAAPAAADFDQEATAVQNSRGGTAFPPAEKSIYNLGGVRQPALLSGINIVRQSDGTVRKVVMR